ncbi:MAG: hypothetical protein QW438_05105 [Ignisphaera sp.]|uniref:Uncharacterized protein n=1 Tax=Ignisphaera aggregans TaxID=334771 RepID=A0A7J3JQ83_9CREN
MMAYNVISIAIHRRIFGISCLRRIQVRLIDDRIAEIDRYKTMHHLQFLSDEDVYLPNSITMEVVRCPGCCS